MNTPPAFMKGWSIMKKYIAYGSNLNVEQMKHRCPNARILCTGEIEDYKLLFKGSLSGNYLTIEPCKGRTVPVVVWEVTDDCEYSLDVYEGFPRFYRKEYVPIKTQGGIMKDAFAYIMNGHEIGLPTERYMRTCLSGYASFDFDPEILWIAAEESNPESVQE